MAIDWKVHVKETKDTVETYREKTKTEFSPFEGFIPLAPRTSSPEFRVHESVTDLDGLNKRLTLCIDIPGVAGSNDSINVRYCDKYLTLTTRGIDITTFKTSYGVEVEPTDRTYAYMFSQPEHTSVTDVAVIHRNCQLIIDVIFDYKLSPIEKTATVAFLDK